VVLTRADFSGANLTSANLTRSNLTAAHLNGADLSGANLSGTILHFTALSRATLINADLSGANLEEAFLEEANLSGADLSGANLLKTYLWGTNLSYANLTGTRFNGSFAKHAMFDNLDLRGAEGLEEIRHHAPSSVDIHTIYKSEGKIPEIFLRGCGVQEAFIVQIPALVAAVQPIQFYSCFISYSREDEGLAQRLHADLQSKGVRCWFAPEDLKIGERFRRRIDEVIRVYDRLLLLLSENSVASSWVEKEVETAMESEDEQKRTVLFPVRLDDSVLEIKTGWPADVRRTRHIGDFRRWKDHDEYQKAFNRLLADLKAEA
jgi:hypothetical protein